MRFRRRRRFRVQVANEWHYFATEQERERYIESVLAVPQRPVSFRYEGYVDRAWRWQGDGFTAGWLERNPAPDTSLLGR